MKKYYIFVFSLVFISLGNSALAQQSINNDGIGLSELQPQAQNAQNNSGGSSYSTEDITREVANTKVLQNTQVQQLEVTGAPANSQLEEKKSTSGWVIIFGLFLLILMSPALLYARSIKNNSIQDEVDDKEVEAKVDNNVTEQLKEEDTNKEEESNKAPINEVEEETEKKADKPKKKKKANKQKRGKKKRK